MRPGIVMLILLAVGSATSCGDSAPEGRDGFAIVLAETGDVILSDKDVAGYYWKTHRIELTPEGEARWKSYSRMDDSFDPPIPKLGDMYQKEFIVTVDGAEQFRGYIWSFVSSMMKNGVLLYDILGVVEGELWFSFNRLGDNDAPDPRNSPALAEHFKQAGKLKD